MGFCVVPGNIKQQLLPFLLNPSSPLNKEGDGYKTSQPQYFTYKSQISNGIKAGKINFCPSSIEKYIDEDISMKLTYQYGSKPISTVFSQIINNLPGITIREYLPDTALDQAINFFTDLIKETMSLFGEDGISIEQKTTKPDGKTKLTADEAAAEQESWIKKLQNVSWYVTKYIIASDKVNPNILDSFNKVIKSDSKYISLYSGNEHNKVVEFPYQLYYRLQTCTTTGIYDVPAINSDKHLYSSDGTPGWNTADAGFRFLPKSLQNIPGIGSLLGKLFGNIGISWTPWWDANSGNGSIEPDVKLTFDLYNDTSKAAMMNFIFVNTIIPNNKWIQYGLFQHSPHLYDVKLEGYNRLFACTGQFEVKSVGILRDPPESWFTNSTTGLKKYVNSNIDANKFLNQCLTNKLIKIPDIYHIDMTFKSVLPANFNNYLYSYVANDNVIETYKSHTYDESNITKGLSQAVKDIVKGAKNAWNMSQNYIENTDNNT